MALTKITPQMFDTSAAGHDFNIDNGTFVVDASANRVGIGIATPTTKFHIFDGGTDTGLRIQSAASADNTSSITFDSRLADNTNKQATITAYRGNLSFSGDSSYGKVGIGTTTPSTLLDVNGSVSATTLTVGDILFAGSTISDAADLILDVGGDITLDAGGNQLNFAVGGTTKGRFEGSSDSFVIRSVVSDGDLIFRGNDGGSSVTALTLDMSAAGEATFNSNVGIGGSPTKPLTVFTSAATDSARFTDGTNSELLIEHASGNLLTLATGSTSQPFAFAQGNTEAMRISGGKIGIGTGASTINADSVLHLKSTQPNIYFEDTDDSKSWRLEAGSVFKVQNITTSTEAFRIDQIGTLAVGTTDTHSWNNVFDGRIRIGARGVLATTTGSTQLGHNFYYDGAYKYIGADYATRYYSNNGEHVWLTAPNGSADGTISFSGSRMVITNGGDVSIGPTHSGFSGWRVFNIRGESTGGLINFENSSGTRSATFANQGPGIRYQTHISGGYHRFETAGNTNFPLYIADSGAVSINDSGTSSHQFKVTSSTMAARFQSGNGGYSSITWTGNNGAQIGSLTTYDGRLYIGSQNPAGTGSNGEIVVKPGTTTSTGGVGTTLGRVPDVSLEVGGPLKIVNNTGAGMISQTHTNMTVGNSGKIIMNFHSIGTMTAGDTIVFTYNAISWKSWFFKIRFSSTGGYIGELWAGGYNNNSNGYQVINPRYYAAASGDGASNTTVEGATLTVTRNGQANTMTLTLNNTHVHPLFEIEYSCGGGEGYPRASRASVSVNS